MKIILSALKEKPKKSKLCGPPLLDFYKLYLLLKECQPRRVYQNYSRSMIKE